MHPILRTAACLSLVVGVGASGLALAAAPPARKPAAAPAGKVSTWTVDKPRHMAGVVAAGVDAIVSNQIRQLRRRLS